MEFVLFFLITLLAEVLGTVGGFGSSIFFVSIGQFFYSFQIILALTGVLHIFSNVAKLILFRKTINWKLTLWMGLTSVLFAIMGAYLTRLMDLTYARLILSLFLIGFSIVLYKNPHTIIKPTLSNSLVGGSVAGLLAGLIGTGGAIRGIVLASFNLEKNLFVGTSAAIDFGVDISRTIVYLDSNYLDRELWWYIPLLVLAAFLGSYIGKRALNKISQTTFKKILLALVFSIGIIMLFGELKILIDS